MNFTNLLGILQIDHEFLKSSVKDSNLFGEKHWNVVVRKSPWLTKNAQPIELQFLENINNTKPKENHAFSQ